MVQGIQEIDSGQLNSLMTGGGERPRLIDVRSMAEMEQGMLPGADAMPMHLIPVRFRDLDRNESIVFYCRSGARSGQVCAFLQQQGFTSVVNLRGGIIDWRRQGFPVERPSPESMVLV